MKLLTPEQEMVKSLSKHGVTSADIASNVKKVTQTLSNDVTPTNADHMEKINTPAEDFYDALDILEGDVRYTMLSHLFIISISDGTYDSRSRTLLKSFATLLCIPVPDLVKVEHTIAMQLILYQEDEKMASHGNTITRRNKTDSKYRWLMAGIATVAGGTVIGLTAGLAAPFIGAGIVSALSTFGMTGAGVVGVGTFMTGAGGLAVITTGGVLTGGGIPPFLFRHVRYQNDETNTWD